MDQPPPSIKRSKGIGPSGLTILPAMSMLRLLLLLLFFLVTDILMSPSALGSCGDWLATHSTDRASPTRLISAAETSDPRRPQCRGPRCNRPPAVPFSASRSEVQSGDRESAGSTSRFDSEPVIHYFVSVERRVKEGDGHRRRVERPPQSSRSLQPASR